jgi:uncharacterized membrane protein
MLASSWGGKAVSVASWFLIALIAPFLFPCANHIDKFLLERCLPEQKVGPIIIGSSLFSGLALPLITMVDPDVGTISLAGIGILTATGILSAAAVICYLHALDLDEASFVTPFYQTIPIFAFLLGYFILDETITPIQAGGSVVIILGALALSLEFGRRRIRFKRKVVGLMLAASFLNAINGVLFKIIAVKSGFWACLFWSFVGQVAAGITLLVFAAAYRRDFVAVLRQRRYSAVVLIGVTEIFFDVGESVTLYATLMAPVALVLLVNSFQPLFVFVLGIAASVLVPELESETLAPKKMLQKGAGIGLMVLGGYLISMDR